MNFSFQNSGQSGSIDRLVARAAGFYPSDPVDAALADQIGDVIHDIFTSVYTVGAGLEDKTEARQAYLATGKQSTCGFAFACSV